MLSLVYVSSAVQKFSDAELVELLNQSREKNARLNVTGMLLYKDGNFMQVLEGPDHAVRELFDTIRLDERHRGVLLLLENRVEERQFKNWTMAFWNLNDPALRALPGYSEFLNERLTSEAFQKSPDRARRLLEVFRKNLKDCETVPLFNAPPVSPALSRSQSRPCTRGSPASVTPPPAVGV